MKLRHLLAVVAIAAVASVRGAATPLVLAQALPPLPHSFWGEVTVDGTPAPIGTEIRVGGESPGYYVTSTVTMSGTTHVYALAVPGDLPDTTEIEGAGGGESLRFRVGEHYAEQVTRVWESGANTELNLHVVSVPAPAPTPTRRILNLPPAEIVLDNNVIVSVALSPVCGGLYVLEGQPLSVVHAGGVVTVVVAYEGVFLMCGD